MQNFKKSIKVFVVVIICLSIITTAFAATELIPLGHTTGIKLLSDGAIVINLSQDLNPNPSKDAGIAPGDIITSVNGKHISSNAQLKEIVMNSNGEPLKLEYIRKGKKCTANICPAKNDKGENVIGVWIRDSIAGIGTLTYFNPENKSYAALGHGISDSETNQLIPIERGALMSSIVSGVKKGECGNPGELIGEYNFSDNFANIKKNTESGIFGEVTDISRFNAMKKYPVAEKGEIKRGKAAILSNVDGDKVEEYEIEIQNIYHDGEKTKNMLIHATDPKLIEKTGGIVRGMSGSPIIQNGKLVGAVTHVLVNDPTRGYGIFIENMLEAAK